MKKKEIATLVGLALGGYLLYRALRKPPARTGPRLPEIPLPSQRWEREVIGTRISHEVRKKIDRVIYQATKKLPPEERRAPVYHTLRQRLTADAVVSMYINPDINRLLPRDTSALQRALYPLLKEDPLHHVPQPGLKIPI